MAGLPVFKNFQSTSLFKAFVINAIVAALISTLTIEFRIKLENENSYYYLYTSKFFMSNKLSEFHKVLSVFVLSFLVSFFIYHLMCFLFAFGGGMLTTKKFKEINFISYFKDLYKNKS